VIGQTLSHFRITAKLGEGGMGAVYRAEDTTLGREVALKVLPEAFIADPERLARFEREAKVLASLNHPNIAAIYEVGNAVPLSSRATDAPLSSRATDAPLSSRATEGSRGISEGGDPSASAAQGAAFARDDSVGDTSARADVTVHYLAMELAEGEDLADRLGHGAIPLEEALGLAIQIAEGLVAAHERGIVHRDLKPANIKVTPDGQVKVLDFGLAKAWEGPGGPGGDMTHSPTLTAQMTQAGTLLGTAAYMSPEQARGQEADRRADVWAFGLILTEMLSGRKTFNEPTVSDTLAAVLKTDPDLTVLPAETSPALRRLIERCLRKDPKERLRDMGDVGLELREILAGERGSVAMAGAATDMGGAEESSSRLPGILAGVVIGLLLGLATWWFAPAGEEAATASGEMIRFGIPAPEGKTPMRGLAISPDGSKIALVLRNEHDDRTAIWIRALDDLELRKVEGTDGGMYPFWSPDSRQIGYFAGYGVHVVDLSGTPPRRLADATTTEETRGAAWLAGGTIVYSPHYLGGLLRVPVEGGVEPQAATVLDAKGNVGTHRFPAPLPDGRHFLFYAAPGSGGEPGEIHLGELGSTESRLLTEGHSAPVYSPTGHLVYARGDVLVAHAFDLERLELEGDPIPLGPKLPAGLAVSGLRSLSVADDGTLVYRVEDLSRSLLAWRSRDGTVIDFVDDEAWHYGVAVSPDGRSAAAGRYPLSGRGDLWLYDRARGLGRPLASGPNDEDVAVWAPAGRSIAFLESTAMGAAIKVLDIETGETRSIYAEALGAWPTQWLPDGSGILVAHSVAPDVMSPTLAETGGSDIAMIDLDRPNELVEVLATPHGETDGQVSPNGRWLAYTSDVSGRKEIYVRPFRGAGSDWQVSTEGGSRPRWARDGGELFFLGADGWLRTAEVAAIEPFATAAPERLFDAEIDQGQSIDPGYDVAPDGTFLVNQRADDGGEPVVVVIGMEQLLAKLGRQ
jgi:serine/threonine protein kinase/Tol biopolymer transport system component